MTSLIEDIANKVYNNPYLKSLLCILEKDYVNNLSQIDKKWSLNNKQYKDLIRFIDILSRSKTPKNKNLTIKIISLLIDFPIINDDFFKLLIVNSFVKLGNFPSLQILDNFQDCFYFRELREDYNIKNITNQSPLKHIFTDSQKQLFDELIKSNHYSFSSNTSFGKTFVLTAFIKYIIENKKNENNEDNIALMVPTKALIHQLFKSINEILKDFPNNYKAIISPKIPKYFLNNKNNYIFIFTPERLISFFAENNNPPIKYLFVDEAHKLLSNNDTRSVLIYHAITMANSKDIKIYFSSPNIHNADIFLKIINKNQNFNKYIEESPVTQNKFFIDTTTNDSYMLSDFQENIKIDNLHFKHGSNPIQNLYDLINFISFKNSQSIVYCNTPRNAMEYSTKYAELLSNIKNEEIQETITFIERNIHKSYFLIQCLKKGIAYYFGNMPEELKIQIEYLYNKGVINLLFCTSTLLEGVNLPVKNIFILNEKIGRRRFQKIDFWNLAGRAGRLGKELSGNIFCVRLDKKYWGGGKMLKNY
ncbi:DEAD/DEAH box helicase [Campylobacter canadensis]|uniref:DEAD/DEAH box helicase n=1 Tax=Campylobacter canadensis TaxID=449520 RepID=UPI001553E2DB|nr:DEAD/DEAH box helicase [Campylobacter canadensis]